jgi:hypothetical protein
MTAVFVEVATRGLEAGGGRLGPPGLLGPAAEDDFVAEGVEAEVGLVTTRFRALVG